MVCPRQSSSRCRRAPRRASPAFTELVATAISNAESRRRARTARRRASGVAAGRHAGRRKAPLPHELFAAVTEEVGQLLDIDHRRDGPIRARRHGQRRGYLEQPRARLRLGTAGSGSVAMKVRSTSCSKTGRPARIDDYVGVPGRAAALARDELGSARQSASPIVVEGRLWGALFATRSAARRCPRTPRSAWRTSPSSWPPRSRTPSRVPRSQCWPTSRPRSGGWRRLWRAGVPPTEIVAAVAEEVGRLVSIDGTRILRLRGRRHRNRDRGVEPDR